MKRIFVSLLITAFLFVFSFPSNTVESAKISLSNFIQPTYANVTCPSVGHNYGDCHKMKTDISGSTVFAYCEWTGYQNDHCSLITVVLINCSPNNNQW